MTPIGSIQLNYIITLLLKMRNGFIYVLWEGAINNNEEYNHI